METYNKILLVNPACLDFRIDSEDAQVVPIGLFTIAAQLLDNGITAKILNIAAPIPDQKDATDRFVRELESFQPDIIGFSVTNPSRWSAVECAKKAKQRFPEIKIMFGGPATTFMADHFFSILPELDYAVIGEGETTVLELIQHLQDKKSIDRVNGVVFRTASGITQTSPRSPIQDLDALPHPAKHFVYNHLAMSRGCPGRCTFCGSPKFWGNALVRFHSPEWFAHEIELLYKKGVTHFFISDDTFTSDKTRVLEFCRLIRSKNLDITWNAISRADCIDETLLFEMRTAGCIQISFGVESGSASIRKTLGKPISIDKIIRAFELTRSYGIMPRAYFIYGSPGETSETIKASCDLIKTIGPLSAVFYMMVIFPGTRLYDRAVKENKISHDIWKKKIEDLPWFEVDDHMDFQTVKLYGDQLKESFYSHIEQSALNIELVDDQRLYPFHADFLSRLAMTFSSGEYAQHPKILHPVRTAEKLFEKSLAYAPCARSFLGLAMLHQKKRQLSTAFQLIEKGLKSHPDHLELSICKGVCLMNQTKFSSALEWFNTLKPFDGKDHYINICRQQITGKPHAHA